MSDKGSSFNLVVAQSRLMNNSIFIAAIFAATMLTLAAPMAHAQNATTGTQPQGFRHGFGGHERGFEHGFLGLGVGVRSHIGLGLPIVGSNVGGNAVVVAGAGGGQVQPRIHDFAREHHDHFIFLNNRYVYLPQTVQCPGGSTLIGDQCVVQSQILVQQEAPTILAEQAPQIQGQTVPEVTTGQSTAVTTQTQEVAPTITCPTGSSLSANGQTCEQSTTTLEQIQPIITCPSGTTQQGTTCIQQEQQIVVQPSCGCPDGSTASGSQCIVNAFPNAVIQGSAPDEIIVSGHHFHHEGELPFLRR